MFIIYIIVMFVHAGLEKKRLKKENIEMGYIIDGVNTLFSRFAMVDFETDTYLYLAGTRPDDSGLSVSGSYQDLHRYLTGILTEGSDRKELAEFRDKGDYGAGEKAEGADTGFAGRPHAGPACQCGKDNLSFQYVT